jgi:hypothetical protein
MDADNARERNATAENRLAISQWRYARDSPPGDFGDAVVKR